MRHRKAKKPSAADTSVALYAAMDDLANLVEVTERVRIHLAALAKRHGVPVPRSLVIPPDL